MFVLNMPLGQNQASMIIIMPYYLEPLERLEKLLTRAQVDTWVGKMENTAVAISMPKVSMEVSHNLQVRCPHTSINRFKEKKKRERCDGMSRQCQAMQGQNIGKCQKTISVIVNNSPFFFLETSCNSGADGGRQGQGGPV